MSVQSEYEAYVPAVFEQERQYFADACKNGVMTTPQMRDVLQVTTGLDSGRMSLEDLTFRVRQWQRHPVPEVRAEAKDLIHTVLLPAAGFGNEEPVLSAEPQITDYGYCSEAEAYFVEVFEQVCGDEKPHHEILKVYCTTGPQPQAVLLQKKLDQPTALTLAPVDVDGVVMPAGTIVGVGYNSTLVDESVWHENTLLTVSEIDQEKPLKLEIGRISPWAYEDQRDRALFGMMTFEGQVIKYDADRVNLVTDHTLVDFQQAARRIMERCGVLHINETAQKARDP